MDRINNTLTKTNKFKLALLLLIADDWRVAGSGGHGPAGDHQGDLHHAAVRLLLHRQILWVLLQEHRLVGESVLQGF